MVIGNWEVFLMAIILSKRNRFNNKMKLLEPNEALKSLDNLDYDAYIELIKKMGYSYHSLVKNDESEIIFSYNKNYEDSYDGFFKNILETSHDEIWVCDKEGKTIYCNKTFENNYGINRKEMLGKTAMYLVENGFSDQTPIGEVIRTKKTVSMAQNTIKGRKLIITATPFLYEDGEINFIVENCRDITELEAIKTKLIDQDLEIQNYKDTIDALSSGQNNTYNIMNFKSKAMNQVLDSVHKVAKTSATVLLQGESGTGKSEIAKLVHELSERSEYPLITINCTTIPKALFESEFFGYESGAFTGAKSKGKKGLIELAEKGTIFLDEIGEIPLSSQAKLLQFIQEKSYTKVGGDSVKKVDVRIIAATNRVLLDLMNVGRFREDLYYRLNVVNIHIPALRERQADIALFVEYYLKKFNNEYRVNKTLSNEVSNLFENYSWPGNIREIQNLIHNLVIITEEETILVSDLPPALLINKSYNEAENEVIDFRQVMFDYENAMVRKCYHKNNSSYKLAKALNITQSSAMRLIKKHIENKKTEK